MKNSLIKHTRMKHPLSKRITTLALVFALALVVALLLLAITARASSIARMSIEQITRASSLIARATCVSSATRWQDGEIWTVTLFSPEDVWKGSAPGAIEVRLLGGTAGNVTSTVEGVPHFRAGEEVVLFLEPTQYGDFSVVSWTQGTFRVARNERTGQKFVTQDTAAYRTTSNLLTAPAPSGAGIVRMPLEAFRSRVQAAVANAAQGGAQ
jgi:hypothetical protein